MSEIVLKKEEVIKTVTESSELAFCVGQYLREPACRTWVEDFVDEDTGNVVSIDRKEMIFDRGI